MQPRTVRLVVVPALLLLSVSGMTFGLAGSGVMPANLVEGAELQDVLAYLETILAGV